MVHDYTHIVWQYSMKDLWLLYLLLQLTYYTLPLFLSPGQEGLLRSIYLTTSSVVPAI